jgi:putative hydrolase of the HAD superfamily
MIKNVIFDFGQVLVHFEPDYMCSLEISNPDDQRLVSDVLFDRLYWERLDAGTIEDEEVIAAAKTRLPERLHSVMEKIYYNWIHTLPEIDGMREVIALCREKGFGVYLLSNISTYFVAHYKEIPILEGFDGYVFSSKAGCVKPSADIFRHICDKFGLTPSETLFVDDNAKNIEGAERFGIIPYHFDGNAQALKDYIKRY